MDPRIQVVLMLVFIQIPAVLATTNSDDVRALRALKDMWDNCPPSWNDRDPCDSGWEGIGYSNGRVTSLILNSMDLRGKLSAGIAGLTELQTLDLSYNKNLIGSLPTEIGSLKKLANLILVGCNFSGHIPDTIGSLAELVLLYLNSNSFSGEIPSSIGNLAKLIVLDISDNQLTGTIPISDGISPGLDMLIQTQHFHFGKNQLSGPIPDQLFSPNMALIHLLLDNNKFAGTIPPRLGLVKNLTVVRLDRNSLSGHVPSNLSNLTKVTVLYLSNNELTGPVPDLRGMHGLKSIDMSNNSFQVSDFPQWFSTLQNLTTLKMERTELSGTIPASLFSLPNLQTVMLRKNSINGTLDLGTNSLSIQLRLVDLRENQIVDYTAPTRRHDIEIMLEGNTVCSHEGVTADYCVDSHSQSQSHASYSTSIPSNCSSCNSDESLSPNCTCAYPYTGTLFFRAPSFSNLGDQSYYISLEKSLMQLFQNLPVLSVSLNNLKNLEGYLMLSLQVFPQGKECFNRTGISMIGNRLSFAFLPPEFFGSFWFVADNYRCLEEGSSSPKPKAMNTGIVIGAAAGGSLAVLLLFLAGVYAFRQKRRAERATEQSNPFAKWDRNQSSGSVPHLKGERRFSFEEIKKCTNNFSQANSIGTGGYGKVYKGILTTGQMVAIKRAKQGSMQGSLEFKNEIELLSRVHHKNVVGLVGFCFQRNEQMLVYEYVANGSLKDSLTGKLGIRLEWIKRLKVALGSARGLAYLHELAEPPIIHRDVKSTNILLDERLNAKVADFGLSKLMADREKDHVTTQVKGTMGYMDPEYYISQQLTEKSDVYSFGVLMLELLTARKPIERGKYIVKQVKLTIDRAKNLYNLQHLLDPTLGTTLGGFEKFVDLAMRCVEESGADRPTMGEVVKELENIMQLAGLHPNADSASTSASYEELSKGNSDHPYGSDVTFGKSCDHSPSKAEPK